MLKTILRRLLVALPLLLVISFLSFALISLAPGDYFAQLKTNPQISEQTIERFRQEYNLDKPVYVQYLSWLGGIVQGDLGYSFVKKAPVIKIIGERIGPTLLLSVVSLLLIWLLALPLGIYAAVHFRKLGDKVLAFFSFLGLSLPNFFLALLLLYLASVSGILPTGGMVSVNFDQLSWWQQILDVSRHLILTAAVIALAGVAALQRLMRGNMLEVLGEQYIKTAQAKGLPKRRIVYGHAVRNAINPLITLFGFEFSNLLSGAALTEIITSWPGMGSMMLEAVGQQDLYLVMGGMIIGGSMLIVGNLLADILLIIADPRIHVS